MKHLYTIDTLIEDRCTREPQSIAFYRQTENAYEPITTQRFCTEKRALASAFTELGLKKGDVVGILSSIRYEWELVEKAAISIGCSSFGIDIRHSAPEIETEIKAASIDAIIVEDDKLLAQLPSNLPCTIITIDGISRTHKDSSSYLQLYNLIRENLGRKPHIESDRNDWAIIISTSGTTGEPKLIRYRNHQIIAACLAITEMLDIDKTARTEKTMICWLPLMYMTSKIMNLVDYAAGGSTYFLKNPKDIMDAIQKISPTHFLSVPIFYERMYKGFMDKIQSLPYLKRMALKMLIWIRIHTQLAIAPQIIRSIREQLVGKKMEFAISGSSAVSTEILRLFHALSIPIYEAYALSENAIPVSMNTPESHRIGSVGKPSWRNTVKYGADGEILVKGEGVFEGYIGNKSENTDSFDRDGFLKTGDLGSLDADGYLHITGRKKNIIKTANGYRISPSEIEAIYEAIPYIQQILVVGDRQKFLGALIVLEVTAVRSYLTQHSIPIPSDDTIAKMKEVRDLIAAECSSRKPLLAVYKQIKVFTLLSKPFTIQAGEITENFKLRRAVIIEHYQKEIDRMFKEIQ